MINISIIGTGNVAWHLSRAISRNANLNLKQIVGRSATSLFDFKAVAETTCSPKNLQPTDVILIAVPDATIASLCGDLGESLALIAHTSGSVAMAELKSLGDHGVFYPLQSFTKEREIPFNGIPICVEANTQGNLNLLKQLAGHLSQKVVEMDSKKRAKQHLAAVMANNFGNHLMHLAKEFCDDEKADYSLLKPLMEETIAKAFALDPKEAQTGPAKRGDLPILRKQLESLQGKQLKDIYKKFTNSILKTYGNENL